jgi:hypothetical protein
LPSSQRLLLKCADNAEAERLATAIGVLNGRRELRSRCLELREGCRVEVASNDYLPQELLELADDAAATSLDTLQLSETLLSIAEAFIGAFRDARIVKIEPALKKPPDHGNTVESKHTAVLARISAFVESRRAEHHAVAERKAALEKELKQLSKPGIALPFVAAAIDLDLFGKVLSLLSEKGTNVKGLGQSLGIFDAAQVSRLRKALVVGGVTRETENHQGSQSTWIELEPGFAQPDTAQKNVTKE